MEQFKKFVVKLVLSTGIAGVPERKLRNCMLVISAVISLTVISLLVI